MPTRPEVTDAESATPELIDSPQADQQYTEICAAMADAKRAKVRVRVLVQLYRFGAGQRYTNWRGVLWRLDLEPSLTAAANFRSALAAFFHAVSTIGPNRVVQVLQEASGGE